MASKITMLLLLLLLWYEQFFFFVDHRFSGPGRRVRRLRWRRFQVSAKESLVCRQGHLKSRRNETRHDSGGSEKH